MPSVFSHGIVGGALVSLFPQSAFPRRLWWIGAACAVLPDLDVLAYHFGISARYMLGHRGLTHSVPFAPALALLLTAFIAWRRTPGVSLPAFGLYVLLCTLSHGLLDAMTTGGSGVAFWAPFSSERYFLPWRPIVVSPLSASKFLSGRGLRVATSELFWIGLPALLLVGSMSIRRWCRERLAPARKS